jgi:hypothetical protein
MSNYRINDDQEREIADAAARVLHDRFIEAAKTGTVLYVENDVLMSKTPHEPPEVIKRLRLYLELSKRVPRRGTVKIKKQDIKCGLK